VLLDQQTQQKNIIVKGNNQLLKGSVFALISLVWFFFLFAFVNMQWDNFTPFAPFLGVKEKEKFIFYLIVFSFFISSLIFSLVFYKNNLQPVDILLRFGIILIIFTLVYFIYMLFVFGLDTQKKLFFSGISFFTTPGFVYELLNGALSFIILYFLFYPLILLFSKLFYNGVFGQAGFILCFFITAIFYVALWFLADIEIKLSQTSFPMEDFVVILFFTLTSFGIGVVSGDEEKKRKRSLRTGNTL